MTATTNPVRSKNLRGIPPIYPILVAVFVISAVLSYFFSGGSNFFSSTVLKNIFDRGVSLGIVAVGQTFVILLGAIDLSVAYVISVTAVMGAYFMAGDPSRIPLAIAIVLGIGVLVGLTNGLIITRLKVNPFITTLGTSLLLKGVLDSAFEKFKGSVPEVFRNLSYGDFLTIPIPIFILAAAAAIGWFILNRTPFGYRLFAVGGGNETARLSGIRTNTVIVGAYVFSAVMSVVSGLIVLSRLGSGMPWVGPDGLYDLESIATVVIGGTAMSGGRGGIAGTIAGVIIFGILDTLFNQLGVNTFLKQVLRGLIIIIAVASYTYRSKNN